jgi:hypothetical protein
MSEGTCDYFCGYCGVFFGNRYPEALHNCYEKQVVKLKSKVSELQKQVADMTHTVEDQQVKIVIAVEALGKIATLSGNPDRSSDDYGNIAREALTKLSDAGGK